MGSKFTVEVRDGVVVLTREGAPRFDETRDALLAAVAAARDAGTRKMLFDLRRADLANHYSFIVRHAENTSWLEPFQVAILGTRGQADVIEFIATVRRNRGWKAQPFFDMDEAMEWLRADDGADYP